LKPLDQKNQNFVGSISGRSSINISHLVWICLETWLPYGILVSGCSVLKKKIETAKPEQNVHGRKHLWKVLHKVSSKQNDR
jgi:hypothetical protein